MYIDIHIHTPTPTVAHIHVHVRIHVYTCVHVHLHIHTHTPIHIHVHIHVNIQYAYTYTYRHTQTNTHTHTHANAGCTRMHAGLPVYLHVMAACIVFVRPCLHLYIWVHNKPCILISVVHKIRAIIGMTSGTCYQVQLNDIHQVQNHVKASMMTRSRGDNDLTGI